MSRGRKGSAGRASQAPSARASAIKERLRQKEVEALIQKYESAIKSGDADVSVWAKLGELYDATGEYDKAVKCYDKALMMKPDVKVEVSILSNLANTYAKGGAFEREVECYSLLLKRAPSDPMIWGKAARAYERFGKIQEAVIYYTRAINMNREDANLFYDYSFFCEKLGQLANALSAAERALQLRPDSESALERVAILCAKTGAYDKAIAPRLRLLELRPDDIARWEDLVLVAMANKDYNYVVKVCHKGILRLNSPILWNWLGDAYKAQGRDSNALYCYNVAARAKNLAAKAKADALVSQHVTPSEISLRESDLGEL